MMTIKCPKIKLRNLLLIIALTVNWLSIFFLIKYIQKPEEVVPSTLSSTKLGSVDGDSFANAQQGGPASITGPTQGNLAEELFQRVRVACLVLTMPQNHEKKATAIKETWGKRCNKLIFVSTEEDKNLGTVNVNLTEGRNILWGKTKRGFAYAWHNFKDDIDWFMKTDDDTYVIMENLRYMLSAYNKTDPIWFGYRFNKFMKGGYMSGGGGYVLSREAVKRFVLKALPDGQLCKNDDTGAEDVEIGKCLEKVGVKPLDSRDAKQRERFHPFTPRNHIEGLSYLKWYLDYTFYPPKKGLECCSNTSITFHYITPQEIRLMDYLLYYLKPVGLPLPSQEFPPPIPNEVASVLQNMTAEDRQEAT